MPKFSFFIILFTSLFYSLSIVPTVIVTAIVINIYSAATFLFILFVVDFITGVGASYCIWKKTKKKEDKWFFGKGEGFNSSKFRKMFVKLLVYLFVPIGLVNFQNIFMIRNIKYEVLSVAEIDLATAAILLFCINEGFSIFHENLPKCGFNIFDTFKKIKQVKNDLES